MITESAVINNTEDNSFTILTHDDRGWTAQRFGCEGRLRTYAVGPLPTRWNVAPIIKAYLTA